MNQCERVGCDQPGTVRRLIPVTQVRSEWMDFCEDHKPTGYTRFDDLRKKGSK